MIQSIQKVIRVGSSAAVTLPAKELRRQRIRVGDEVEVVIRPVQATPTHDQAVMAAAQEIIATYRQDFENLAHR